MGTEKKDWDKRIGIPDNINLDKDRHPTTLPSDEEIKMFAELQSIGYVAGNYERNLITLGAKWMRSLCEAKIAEMEKYKSLVIELAEWSRKYPRDRIYSMRKIKMDDELIALENKAKELTTTP